MTKLAKHELARRTVRDVYVEVNDGDRLDELLTQYGPGCWLNFDYGYYDDPMTVHLIRDREENDEEYDARIADLTAVKAEMDRKVREAKKRKDEDERKTYERLRKKFEKD